MTKLFFGNWKMTLLDDAAVALAAEVAEAAEGTDLEVAVAPSFTALAAVAQVLQGSKADLGAQDSFWEEKGAWTGEVSPTNLKALGCRYVLLGHSERRTLGETDEIVAKKVAAALKAGLTPVLCLGETKAEKDAGQRDAVVRRELSVGLSLLPPEHAEILVAYEPRWAIGTGVPCLPADAAEVHRLIKSLAPEGTRVLYGGSVDPANIASFTVLPEVDGVLVGGASTVAEKVRAMLAAMRPV